MQEFQKNGPILSIKQIEWDNTKTRNLFLSLLPSGPLFEGYHKNDTIKECFAFIFSFMPLTFWQMGHPSTNCLRAAFTFVASPRSFAHLVPHLLISLR